MRPLLPLICLGIVVSTPTARAATVLIEAESFADLGGWVIDTQAMDQIGSPYLLAHGLGVPVKDASTTVVLPVAGRYRVFVRTRDWVANWNAPGSPGKFQLLIDGRPLKTTFGAEGAAWHWQDGGMLELSTKQVKLSLRDLTGFEGRCDAIALTTDYEFSPPEKDPEMHDWRRKVLGMPEITSDNGNFDLVVVGGGMAGCCAAVSAARLGLAVALVQDRPLLGGNNSSEIRVHLQGNINQKPYPRLGDLVAEIGSNKDPGNAGAASGYEDDRKLRVVHAEKNVRLFLNTRVSRLEMDEREIRAVIGRNVIDGREMRLSARWFADCTGDAAVGYMAGADFRVGREPRNETGEPRAPEKPDAMTMGTSVQWYSTEDNHPSSFPQCPWALQFTEKTCPPVIRGKWNWEAGMGKDQIGEIEQIRDLGFRAIYGTWAFLKNHDKTKAAFANRRLEWVAYVGGKRESRRLLGDVILKEQDITDAKPFPDACVTATWDIDLHLPHPKNAEQFPGQAFRSVADMRGHKPYPIPYRCLYSRNVSNLFMAGRDISVTHVALGAVRVMRTCGMMGEVLGMAASICKKHDAMPRDVYEKHLDELKQLMTLGVGIGSIAGASK